MVFVFDAPVELALARLEHRGVLDRLEKEKLDFFERVRRCYLERASADPKRYKVIDATQKISEVQKTLQKLVEDFLKQHHVP